MTTVLVATEADEVCDEIDAALTSEEVTVFRVRRGADVEGAVHELDPAVVIIDLQIGSMGGIAAAMNLRLEESGGRMRTQRIILLLDRGDDVFLARRSGADAWLVKPLDSRRVADAVDIVLAGGRVEEGPAPAGTPAP